MVGIHVTLQMLRLVNDHRNEREICLVNDGSQVGQQSSAPFLVEQRKWTALTP